MRGGPERPVFARGVSLPEGTRLLLPEGKRARLAAPFGDVFAGDELQARTRGSRAVAAVGDITAGEAIRRGVKPRFIAVDFKTKRGPVPADDAVRTYGEAVLRAASPAGVLTADLYNAVLAASFAAGATRIEVDGEEDLAVLPAIIHLEPGATVLYGLPDRGLTAVKVDDESKRVAFEFLESFVVMAP